MTALKGKIKIFLFFCLLFNGQPIFALDGSKLSDEIWKELTQDIDYGEVKELEPKEEEEPNSSYNFISSDAFKIIVITLCIIGLTLLLTRILGVNAGRKKITNQNKNFNVDDGADEELFKSDLDSLLEELISNEQYRSALRILYLQSLRFLNDSDFIHWEKEKTNFDYIRELSSRNFQGDFRELTLIFELIWYGESSIDKQGFDLIQDRFIHFKTSIQNE